MAKLRCIYILYIWFSWIRLYHFYQRIIRFSLQIKFSQFLSVFRKPSWPTGIKYFEQNHRQPLDNFTKLVKTGHAVEALLACISGWLVCRYFPFVLWQQRTNSDNYPCGKIHLWGIHECIVGWVAFTHSVQFRPRVHGSGQIFARTGRTGRIFEQLSVQVWDLKKAGQLFDRHGFIFHTDSCKHVQLFAQIARLWPGIKCRDWSKLCTDPCKHHCNRICTVPCKQAVQKQNLSVQKFVRTRVNGALDLDSRLYIYDLPPLQAHHLAYYS